MKQDAMHQRAWEPRQPFLRLFSNIPLARSDQSREPECSHGGKASPTRRDTQKEMNRQDGKGLSEDLPLVALHGKYCLLCVFGGGENPDEKRTMKDWSGHQGQRKTTTIATATTISTVTSLTTAIPTTTRKQN